MNEDLTKMELWSDEEVLTFIRKRLTITLSDHEFTQLGIFSNETIKLRFEMSGYEGKTGEVTIGNQTILNRFADLGIYDYTTYLFLDFYKGIPTLYMQYFMNGENEAHDFSGYSTSEIIHEIFKRTIFTNNATRRRN